MRKKVLIVFLFPLFLDIVAPSKIYGKSKIEDLIHQLRKAELKEEEKEIYNKILDLGESAIPYLLNTFKNKYETYRVKELMARLLGDLKAKDAVPSLIDFFRKNRGKTEARGVRSACIYALGKMGDPSLIPILKEALLDREGLVIASAYLALKNKGIDTTRDLLKNLQDPTRALSTLEAILEIKESDSDFPMEKVPSLLKPVVLNCEDSFLVCVYIEEISMLKTPGSFHLLLEIAKAREKFNEDIRLTALSRAVEFIREFPFLFSRYLDFFIQETSPRILTHMLWDLNHFTGKEFSITWEFENELEREMIKDWKVLIAKEYQKIWEEKHKKQGRGELKRRM